MWLLIALNYMWCFITIQRTPYILGQKISPEVQRVQVVLCCPESRCMHEAEQDSLAPLATKQTREISQNSFLLSSLRFPYIFICSCQSPVCMQFPQGIHLRKNNHKTSSTGILLRTVSSHGSIANQLDSSHTCQRNWMMSEPLTSLGL